MKRETALPTAIFRSAPARRALGILWVSLGLMAMAASGANLVDNGDFANVGNVFVENVSLGADDILTPGGTKIPGWTNVTPPGAPSNYANEMWVQAANGYGVTASPNNGSGYFVDLTGENNAKPYGGLAQKVVTTVGMGYSLTFALGASTLYNTSGLGAAALTASATGTALLSSRLFTLTPTAANQWAAESLTFVADSDSTSIEFLADSSNTSRYVGLDNVSLVTRLLPVSISLTTSKTTAPVGAAVSLTALVKQTEGTVTPTGKEEFKSGTQILGSVSVNGAGQATLTTSTLPAGSDTVTAVYSGDTLHGTATSKSVSVAVTGGAGLVTLSPTSISFGNQAVGSMSSIKTVTITNGGSAAVSLSSIALGGSLADNFTLTKTCGSSLAAKASCSLSITFKPVSATAKTAYISITDNVVGSPQKVNLSGTGVAASASSLSLSPSSLEFGSLKVGSASSPKTVTVSNHGRMSLSLTAITLTGSQAHDFSLSKTCGSTLAAGASCTLSVAFTPVVTGAKVSSVSVTGNAGSSPQVVQLGGTGD